MTRDDEGDEGRGVPSDTPRGGGEQPLIRGFPNEATPPCEITETVLRAERDTKYTNYIRMTRIEVLYS